MVCHSAAHSESEFMVRMDRFSRGEETGRLPTMEVKITTLRPTGWRPTQYFKKTKVVSVLKNQAILVKNAVQISDFPF